MRTTPSRTIKRLVLLASLMLPIYVCVQAQSTNLIANVINRQTVSLNDQWKVIIDPYNIGEQRC